MTDTRGFDVVVEGTAEVLLKALQGAWKSAECPVAPGDEGRIPEFMDLPPGTTFGGYNIAAGHVQIPRDELGAQLAPNINGAELKLGLHIQAEIADPPVPSTALFQLRADLRARVPMSTLPNSKNVGLILTGLPRGNVTATLTSGDPLAPKLAQIIREFFHRAYENGSPDTTTDPNFPTIPHEQDQNDISWGVAGVGTLTLDTHTELYDDLNDPSLSVVVTLPQPDRVRITIPLYLRMYRLRPTGVFANVLLRDPMGVRTRLVINANLETPPGLYRIRLDTATVTTDVITPAPGQEGTNYTSNKAAIPFINLDTLISNQIASRGTTLVHGMGATQMAVPTVAQIEQEIGDVFHAELTGRGSIAVWTPETGSSQFDVLDVTVAVLQEAFAIAINSSAGADAGALASFVPAGREFAIAMSGSSVQAMIDAARVQNGFADSDLPKRMREDDKDVDLNELDVGLAPGSIHMTGEVTVIDAVLGSIDVDADFTVDVGFHWTPNGSLNADGVQRMAHHIIGEPDVDPHGSVAFWIIAIILAVISFGTGSVLIGIIIVVVAAIITAIAEGVGGTALVDGVTGAVSGVTAWPPELSRIGTVRAIFSDPIDIGTTGLVMSGTLEVVSSCESVQVVPADSGSAYSVAAASPLLLKAQREDSQAAYAWLAGDGAASVATKSVTHTYIESGTYVARHTLSITAPGGATSRHFALVDVRNVPPTVDAGEDVTVNEGELLTLVGRFSDVEYPDTHETMWYFGDPQRPDPGVVAETNSPPTAEGTSTVTHAWCDNGQYIVTLRVRDQNGGIGEDSLTVTVLNVPPVVDPRPDLYAYPCSVITLVADFTDPGWCDTHEGTWEFGDCRGEQMATIEETNEAPEARGTVTASHVYTECGNYTATCTVTDDDSGVGRASLTVRVVDILNKNFEDGFRELVVGRVANDWQPYVLDEKVDDETETDEGVEVATESRGLATHDLTAALEARPGQRYFAADQEVVVNGQRAQAIVVSSGEAAGIWQLVGANPGWTYEVRTRYSTRQAGGGAVRLGVDPAGGTNPSASTIVWVTGNVDNRWADLVVRAVATSGLVTIFAEAIGDAKATSATMRRSIARGFISGTGRGTVAYIDAVSLVAIQPSCPPEETTEPEPEERCLSFEDARPDTTMDAPFEHDGFTVLTLDQAPAVFVAAADLPTTVLMLRRGVLVELPYQAARVVVVVCSRDTDRVSVTAVGADGSVIDRADAVAQFGDAATVVVRGAGIASVQVGTKTATAGLVSVCADTEQESTNE